MFETRAINIESEIELLEYELKIATLKNTKSKLKEI